jgi:hypothetical protein
MTLSADDLERVRAMGRDNELAVRDNAKGAGRSISDD